MSDSADSTPILSEIAGIPVAELAARFGTPVYVYDAATIERQLAALRAFDVVRYAAKACSSLAILDLCRRQAALVDTVSAFEIRRALKAGFAPTAAAGEAPPIVYTADIFDAESLELVVRHDIHVNCGSPDMIAELGARAPGREITLRVNPGFGHGHSRKTNTGGEQSKHGIWHEQIADCVAEAERVGLRVTGLHMHIGSGADLEHLSRVCEAMEHAAGQAGEHLASVSAGGGLSIPYRAGDEQVDVGGYHARWDAARRRIAERVGRAIRLEIEPGRYVVAESGFLVAEIRAIKRMGRNLFYLLDAGFNNLARPILYGASHPMSIAPGAPGERALREVVVGGPLCESGDIFTQGEGGVVTTRTLPEARVGEHLVIGCAGAYGFVMGSNYNSKPLAAEVLARDGEAHLIRARQSFEDVVRGERIP